MLLKKNKASLECDKDKWKLLYQGNKRWIWRSRFFIKNAMEKINTITLIKVKGNGFIFWWIYDKGFEWCQ